MTTETELGPANFGNTAESPEVLVVGAGPTGLSVANLLGVQGVSVLVVDRHPRTSTEPKAISLDDESLRILHIAGADEFVYPILMPGFGTRYHGAHGQVLFDARGTARHGHPFKNPFAQPDLEQALLRSSRRFTSVSTLFLTEVTACEAAAGFAKVTLREGDRTRNITPRFVLGCDGSHSIVRECMGVHLIGQRFDDVWLVVDMQNDAHDQRYGLHFGQPSRPTVVIPGRDGRCRYEFLLHPNEVTSAIGVPFPLIEQLVGKHRSVAESDVERAVTYTFNALMAAQWRTGQMFLLGDAAHMMPPFAGQGLNSGIRDAANLAWKIHAVLRRGASDLLLNSYELERRPHAEAMMAFSVRLGSIVMTTRRWRARARDLIVRTIQLSAAGRRYLNEMRFRPNTPYKSGFVVGPAGQRNNQLVGRFLPQPWCLPAGNSHFVRLDEVLGDSFALLGVDLDEMAWASVNTSSLTRLSPVQLAIVLDERMPRSQGERIGVADADGEFDRLFSPVRIIR